jgi:hypothetical protein
MPKVSHRSGPITTAEVAGVSETPAPVVADKPKNKFGRENVAFELPDGRVVTIGLPPIPIQMILPAMFSSSEDQSGVSAAFVEILSRAMLHVREIDNKNVAPPVDYKGVTALCMQLGQDGIDAVLLMVAEHFPSISREQLKVIKK